MKKQPSQKRVPDKMFIGISLGLLCLEVLMVLMVGWVVIQKDATAENSAPEKIAIDY